MARFTGDQAHKKESVTATALARLGGLVAVLLAMALSGARCAERDDVQQATNRGVTHLQKLLAGTGSVGDANKEGYTALAALTLLECGVDPSNPVIQKAASVLRQGSVTLTHTYSISLTIMFLDRLGEEEDDLIIEALATRLLGGQNALGGWTYQCPPSESSVTRRLTELLQRGKGRETDDPLSGRPAPTPATELLEQADRMRLGVKDTGINSTGDNSNTQFATLGLWIARRHGLPVDRALRLVEERFRRSQNLDGGWSYIPAQRSSTPSMTCAALLGLAVAHGMASSSALRTIPKGRASTPPPKGHASRASNDPIRDPAIYHGLQFLGRWIDSPLGSLGVNVNGPGVVPQPQNPQRAGTAIPRKPSMYDYYLMWSVERVCSAFGRKVVGRRDWYDWGADIILAAQNPDGSWDQAANSGVCTSFALLFLSRSNLARDLSETLRGRIRDGEARLRSTGGATGSPESAPSPGRSGTTLPRAGSSPSAPLGDKTGEAAEAGHPTEDALTLGRELAAASSERQAPLIEKLRDGTGSAYTEALANAIGKLSASAQLKAQDALVERLARMKPSTLLDKLQDENGEVRRAAALACAMKGTRELLPEVVKLLTDREARVMRAAHRSLQLLTGQDFGPGKDATQAEIAEAAKRWKSYWAKQLETAPDAEKQEATETEQDRKQLEGSWQLVGVEAAGQTLSRQAVGQLHTKLSFSGSDFTLRSATAVQSGKYTLTANLRPREIDLDNGKEISRGIYQIEDDELRICFVLEGPNRPRAFLTKPSSKQYLWTLKRQKPK
jgi:uncharacterized protein (TIGR03067 family)